MPSDKKARATTKKQPSAVATKASGKSFAKGNARTGSVVDVYKDMAAIATAHGTRPPTLSEKHKKLLDRQAALIKVIQTHGVSGINPAHASNQTTVTQPPNKPKTKSSIQELAKRVGIWTASGKLSSSYKK